MTLGFITMNDGPYLRRLEMRGTCALQVMMLAFHSKPGIIMLGCPQGCLDVSINDALSVCSSGSAKQLLQSIGLFCNLPLLTSRMSMICHYNQGLIKDELMMEIQPDRLENANSFHAHCLMWRT